MHLKYSLKAHESKLTYTARECKFNESNQPIKHYPQLGKLKNKVLLSPPPPFIAVYKDSYMIYACGFDRNQKLSGFTESWESLESRWIPQNLIYSYRVTYPLSNNDNVYFVKIHEDYLLNMTSNAKINNSLWCPNFDVIIKMLHHIHRHICLQTALFYE